MEKFSGCLTCDDPVMIHGALFSIARDTGCQNRKLFDLPQELPDVTRIIWSPLSLTTTDRSPRS